MNGRQFHPSLTPKTQGSGIREIPGILVMVGIRILTNSATLHPLTPKTQDIAQRPLRREYASLRECRAAACRCRRSAGLRSTTICSSACRAAERSAVAAIELATQDRGRNSRSTAASTSSSDQESQEERIGAQRGAVDSRRIVLRAAPGLHAAVGANRGAIVNLPHAARDRRNRASSAGIPPGRRARATAIGFRATRRKETARETSPGRAPRPSASVAVAIVEIEKRARRREFLALKQHRRLRHQQEQRRHRAETGRGWSAHALRKPVGELAN